MNAAVESWLSCGGAGPLAHTRRRRRLVCVFDETSLFQFSRRPLFPLPSGWDKHSYGYHGDDGHSFCSSGTGQPYGPTFTTGDVIGCCVNLINNTCFYTKNGHSLGEEDKQTNKQTTTPELLCYAESSSLIFPPSVTRLYFD